MSSITTTLWIDAVNEKIAKKEWDFIDYVSSTSDNYQAALRAAQKAASRMPYAVDRKAPGYAIHVDDDEMEDFLSLVKRFYREDKVLVQRPNKVSKCYRRPKVLHMDDIHLNEKFYRFWNLDLNRLNERQLQQFIIHKDVIHERYYGKIERFNTVGHEYITKDRATLRIFVFELKKLFKYVRAPAEPKSGRYFRQFINYE